MFVAVLLTAPGRVLDSALATGLRNAWGGGAFNWLAPGEAVEFSLPVRPDHFDAIWADLQAMGVDLLIVPAQGRRKRLLLADMDSTMIGQECIDELAAEAGVGPQVAAITARAMNGELDFEGALDARVALLRGLPEGVIDRVLANRITLAPGGRALVATMRAQGAYAALVSGGFTAFTAPIAQQLGFDEHRANLLDVSGGHLTGTVARPILGRAAKVTALEDIASRLGLTPDEAIAVGDGANDLGMLGRAGLGVAVHAKPVVQEQAQHRVNHGDLTALLYLQGYAQAEFVI